ncbi:hypothetical protein Sjap_002192 [Stephania japonica]|uniref:UBX domain-containing protein n=1 Tax=Stephania japonica TaxID=461633 RepID=A0AAP0KNP7_9MAGN
MVRLRQGMLVVACVPRVVLSLEMVATMDYAVDDDDDDDDGEESKLLDSLIKKQPNYLPLPEEPKGVDKTLLCRVVFRLPGDGRRCQRTFLRTDPLKLLWYFCRSQLKETEAHRPFHLANAIPCASKVLDYEREMTLGECDLANSLISVTWEIGALGDLEVHKILKQTRTER